MFSVASRIKFYTEEMLIYADKAERAKNKYTQRTELIEANERKKGNTDTFSVSQIKDNDFWLKKYYSRYKFNAGEAERYALQAQTLMKYYELFGDLDA